MHLCKDLVQHHTKRPHVHLSAHPQLPPRDEGARNLRAAVCRREGWHALLTRRHRALVVDQSQVVECAKMHEIGGLDVAVHLTKFVQGIDA